MHKLGALCCVAAISLTLSASGTPPSNSQGDQVAQALGKSGMEMPLGSWVPFAPMGHGSMAMGDHVNPW